MPNKYTEFIEQKDGRYKVRNIIYDEYVAFIKERELYPFSDIKFSNGCIKEILKFIYIEKIEEEKQGFIDRGDGPIRANIHE